MSYLPQCSLMNIPWTAVLLHAHEQLWSAVFIAARAPSARQTPPRTRRLRCSWRGRSLRSHGFPVTAYTHTHTQSSSRLHHRSAIFSLSNAVQLRLEREYPQHISQHMLSQIHREIDRETVSQSDFFILILILIYVIILIASIFCHRLLFCIEAILYLKKKLA